VFGISSDCPRCCTGRARTGVLCCKAVSKHVCIFLKTDSFLEDSLCAPGSPLLRSKDAAWLPVS
jgi:hypothetical protein